MKTFSISLPTIDITDVSNDTLVKFAEKHNDNYIVGIANEPNRDNEIKMTVVRVLRHETGLDFVLVNDDDDTFVVYVPNMKKTVSFDQLFETVSPYMSELLLPYQRSFTYVEFSVTDIVK